MKRVLKTLAIHLFCILFFAIFYYYFSTHFEKNIQNKCNNNCNNNCNNSKNDSGLKLIIDFLLFSTTIQAGVGINELSPISILGKVMMIIQQLIMISINVLTIYVFTM
jgi:hypothetical protein